MGNSAHLKLRNLIIFINQNLNLVSEDGCEKYELLSMRKVLEHLVKSHKPLLGEVGYICEGCTHVITHTFNKLGNMSKQVSCSQAVDKLCSGFSKLLEQMQSSC